MPFRLGLGRDRSRDRERWSDAQRLRYWWRIERELLIAALERVPASDRQVPLAEGEWSPTAIVAHRLFWEAEEHAALVEHLSGDMPSLLELPTERIDPTNARAVEALGDRPLLTMVRALVELRNRTSALVERLSDDELNEPGSTPKILLGVALEHDREHRRQLEAKYGALSETGATGQEER